ncbi:MAG: hypothetical protein ABSD78_03155 [Acidimicrobiales bacterium]
MSAPEGQRSITNIIWVRNSLSFVPAPPTTFQTFVVRLPQQPACSQIARSPLTTTLLAT